MSVTKEQIEPIFEEFKRKLTSKFPEVYDVELYNGIVKKGFTSHDIDIRMKIRGYKKLPEIIETIASLSVTFPLDLDVGVVLYLTNFTICVRSVFQR